MTIPAVDLKAQYATLKPEIDRAVQDVIDSTTFILGPAVEAFEEAFAAYHGVRHCVGVSNGTDALSMTLLAAGVEPGDEVITSPNTLERRSRPSATSAPHPFWSTSILHTIPSTCRKSRLP